MGSRVQRLAYGGQCTVIRTVGCVQWVHTVGSSWVVNSGFFVGCVQCHEYAGTIPATSGGVGGMMLGRWVVKGDRVLGGSKRNRNQPSYPAARIRHRRFRWNGL